MTTHPEVPGCFSSIIDIPPAVISSKDISQAKGRRAAGKTFGSSIHLARTTKISMVKSKARYDMPFPVGLPSLCRLDKSSPKAVPKARICLISSCSNYRWKAAYLIEPFPYQTTERHSLRPELVLFSLFLTSLSMTLGTILSLLPIIR